MTAYDDIRIATDRAELEHQATVDQLTAATALIDSQEEQIAALKAALAECEAGHPPDPPASTMLVGASIKRRTGETVATATSRFEASIGKPIQIGRRFTGTFPSNFMAVTEFAVDANQRHRFISVKGTPTAGNWDTFLRSIPSDGFGTWVTINHEPENDGGTMTPAVFKAKLALMLAAIRRTGRTDIHPAFVLMSWLERDDVPGTSSDQWFPDEPAAFTMGIDPYDPNNQIELWAKAKPTVDLWYAAGGREWMITETGTHRTGQDAARWVTQAGAECEANGCGGLMWFDSDVGSAAGPTGWFLDACGPAAQQAYAALIKSS